LGGRTDRDVEVELGDIETDIKRRVRRYRGAGKG
jgi:hypothetical protein